MNLAYQTLGVLPEDTPRQIKIKVKKLILKCHSDKGGSDQKAVAILKAQEILEKVEVSGLDKEKYELCLLPEESSGSWANEEE